MAKAKYLLSIIGVLNCIVRFTTGFVSDLLHIRALYIAAVGMTIGGISTVIVSMTPSSFASLGIYSSLFAAGTAAYSTLISIVIVELFGLEKLTNCFGILQFFRGVGAILGPPFGGFVAEQTGSYKWAFIMAGIAMIVSGIAQGFLLVTASWEGEVRSKRNRIDSSASAIQELNQILAQPKEQLI